MKKKIMYIEEDYVSIETARLLAGYGFDWHCPYVYAEKIPGTSTEEWDEEECAMVTKTKTYIYPKPTLSMAQKWLREKRDIHITIDNNASGYHYVLYKTDGTFIKGSIYSGPNDGGVWNTYEEALSNAIFESLKF